MTRPKIRCSNCGQGWLAALSLSFYERQRLESCPCPHCGAYTMCCSHQDNARPTKEERRPADSIR